ncbi:MAG: isochorismatase family protein [Nocardioides sp.]|uniref:isochorismatase family protein n=1 Tax=Nocardioides sp. TaxID=35761 RepID=UPI0039E4A8CE
MTLPTLVDYATPTDLPRSRAGWTLERDRAAVLVHDLQRYFLRPFAPGCAVVTDALVHTAAVIEAARSAGVPVFYTAQTGERDAAVPRGLQGDLWGGGMSPVADHTEIVPEVAPAAGDTVLVKHRYSAFAHSDLAERLRAEGRDQLVITGVYAHIGVLATTFDAFQREVQPFVVADAVADLSEEDHARALAQVAGCCGSVTTASRVLEALAVDAGDAGETGDAGGLDALVRSTLDGLLPAEAVEAAFADPEANLFELGLDSLRAFELLDALAEAGTDIDFGEFAREASVAFVRASARSGHDDVRGRASVAV